VFKSQYRLRMHDTDMARIIFFVSLFRIAHVVWEEILETAGLSYQDLFIESSFAFVVVHAEADYKLPLVVGDRIEIECSVGRVGNSSFTLNYELFKGHHQLAATVTLIFASINPMEKSKISIPDHFREFLAKI
jgi:1,4-dihydroxy-2-naphthoyl-CoA hydrolase